MGAGDTRRGCVVQFTPEEIKAIHLSIAEMDRGAVDMLVLGLISSCINMSEMANADRLCDRKERQRTRCTYKYFGRPVCVTTFRRLLGRMSKERLQNLQDHFKQNGLVPRKLKSGGRKNNTKALTFDDTDAVRRFLLTYAEAHAVHLPGRVPGFKRDDIQLLPSDRS
ncbi:hypothetical protein V1264_017624 [Littorina saxatilis]|uniref:Uncharacterized protein n=1 Tax=Littorina saxatilis TaxID=31220 RepID=A0AAN9BJZ3_9CAEN